MSEALTPGEFGRDGAEFVHPVRVYIEDTDAGGIVFYANYLRYLERARSEMMRSLGVPQAAAFAPDLLFVVRDLSLRYHAPARLDDLLEVSAEVLSVGAGKLRMRQRVSRCGDCLVEGEVVLACVERASGRAQRMPASLRELLAARCAPQPVGSGAGTRPG